MQLSSEAGGGGGIGRDFDIFQKIDVKFPILRQKCEVKYNFVVTGTKNIQISLPQGQQDNSNAQPPGQSDSSKSRPMPFNPPPPPCRLDIDRCIIRKFTPYILPLFCKIHTNSASSENLCCTSILRFPMFSFSVAESSLTYIF